MQSARSPTLAVVLVGSLGVLAPAQQRLPPALDVAEFAARQQHWAWQPLREAAPPRGEGLPAHPVDSFVMAGLRAHGLALSPPAAPHVLLRRLWFDLAGLPPPAEAQARFLADPDEAYLREVELLLASPAFAECQARHWLDLVRYAETLGHESDYAIPNAWRYRDYVIRAIDADVPFDAFVREHIAGDLLPIPRRGADGDDESVQATAFWWFAEQTHSPVDARQHESDRIDNQIDVFGKAVLGMTVACARCHDHKFDAIRAADYYALAGFLRSSRYVQAPMHAFAADGPEFTAALLAQRELAAAFESAAGDHDAGPSAGPAPPRPVDRVLASADDPVATWIRTNDAFGPGPWTGPWCPDPRATPPQLLELPGAWWHSGIAGAGREGVLQTQTFVLDEPFVHVQVAGRHSRVQLVVDGLNLLRAPIYGGLHQGVDREQPHWLTFDVRAWRGSPAYVQCLDQRAPELADEQRSAGDYPGDAWLAVQAVLASHDRTPPPPAAGLLRCAVPWTAPPTAVAAALQRLDTAQAAMRVAPTLPAMGDGSGVDAHVLLRGDHRTPGAVAPRRFLEALGGREVLAPPNGSGRLALADAVFAADAPLPARTFVNRIWHHLFGAGLAPSVDNLGALGEPPMDPDLLDWLARDCIAHGWSRKHVIRRIVTSATYRQQSSEVTAEADPRNRLHHRQNVRRLEAEAVRDAILAVSGLLRSERFGPPVALPLEQFDEARGRPQQSGPIDGGGRRSIYLAVRRNFLAPMLLAFDLPTPFATVGARSTANVPAQSLTLLNDPFVHWACAHWAEHLGALRADPDAGLEAAFRAAFARPPGPDERAQCRELLAAAAAVHGGGQGDPAAWADLLHCLLNTKEFTFRR